MRCGSGSWTRCASESGAGAGVELAPADTRSTQPAPVAQGRRAAGFDPARRGSNPLGGSPGSTRVRSRSSASAAAVGVVAPAREAETSWVQLPPDPSSRPSQHGGRAARHAPAKRGTAVRVRPVSLPKGEGEMTTLEIVEQGTILRATVGSTVHGLHHGGPDNRDEMAVFIERWPSSSSRPSTHCDNFGLESSPSGPAAATSATSAGRRNDCAGRAGRALVRRGARRDRRRRAPARGRARADDGSRQPR